MHLFYTECISLYCARTESNFSSNAPRSMHSSLFTFYCQKELHYNIATNEGKRIAKLGLHILSPVGHSFSSEPVQLFFQVLASYIRPFRTHTDSHEGQHSPSSSEGPFSVAVRLLELLEESCLIPALSSYLRNDSGLLSYHFGF